MQHHQERRVDKGVDKGNVESHLVGHALLRLLVVPVPVEESDEEQGTPEYEICSGYHWTTVITRYLLGRFYFYIAMKVEMEKR